MASEKPEEISALEKLLIEYDAKNVFELIEKMRAKKKEKELQWWQTL